MDPTNSKPAGWYPSSRTPGMERFWNGDYWTSEYRPAQELASHLGAPSADESNFPSEAFNSPESEHLMAPSVRSEYSSIGYTVANRDFPTYGSAPMPVQPAPRMGFSITALILAFFIPLVGAILGHFAYSRAKKEGAPTGVSLAAIIVGWVFVFFGLLFWGFIFLSALISYQSNSYTPSYDYDQSQEFSYDDTLIENYSLSLYTEEALEQQYPDYYWFFADCNESLNLEPGATTDCAVTLYPLEEGGAVFDEFTATVEYVSGDKWSPELKVNLNKEPLPLDDYLSQQ